MKILTRDDLLKPAKLKVELVELENDNAVYIKQLTGAEKEAWEQSLMVRVIRNGKTEFDPTLKNFRTKLAVVTVCDAEGIKLFKPTDTAELNAAISATDLETIVDAAQKLNKISEGDKEDLLKNSEAVQDGNSTSDSVDN